MQLSVVPVPNFDFSGPREHVPWRKWNFPACWLVRKPAMLDVLLDISNDQMMM